MAEGYQASLDRQKVSLGTRALKSFMQTWGPTGRVDPETGETRGPGGWYGSYMSPEERAALGIEKGGYAPGMAGAQAQIARFLPQMTEYSHEALAEMVTTSAEGSARVLEALKTGGNISAAMGKEFEASPLGSHLRESRTFKRSQQMGENEMLTPLGEELREKGGQRAALLDFIKQKAGSASEFVQAGFKALQHQNVSPEMRRVMTAALEQMGGAATQQPAVSVGNVEQVAAAVQAAETPKPTIPSSQGALWIDTETGGLDPEKNPLLSIGAVAPSGATFYAQIKAAEGMESDAKALAVSGLDPTEGRPEAEVMQELAQFIKDNPHEVIGGANIEGFDRGFLGHAQMRTGVDLGLSKKPGLDVLEQGRKLDLGKNLDEIAEQFGISRSGAHNALTDAQMAAATYKAIEKDLAASPKKVVNPAEFAQKIKAPGGDIAARARAITASKMNIDPSTIEGKSQLLLNMMNLGGRQASLGDWVHETLISEIKQRGYAGFKGSEFEVETPEQQLSASLTLPSGAVIGAHPDLYVPGKMGFDVKSNRMPAEHYSPQQSVQAHSLEIPFKLIQYDPAEAEKARASGDPAAIQAWVKQTLSGGPVDVPLMSMEQLEQRHEAIAQAAPELQPLAESGLASMSPEQQEQFKQLSYGQQIDWGVNAIRGGAPPTQAHPTGGTFGQRQYTSSLAGRTQPAAPTQIAAPTQQQPTQQAPLNVGGLSVMDLGGTPHIVMPLPQGGGPVHGKFWLTDISQGAKIAEGPGHLPSGTKGTLEQTERLFKMLNEQLEPAVDRLEQFKEAVAAGAELTRDERAQLGQDLGTWQRLGPLSKHISGYWEKTAGQFERALEGEGKYKDITNLRYRLGAMNEEAELAKLTMQAQGIDVSGKSPRGRMAQLLDEFSIGGAAIRMGVIGRFTTGQVSQWQEQAMPYQQSMLGFQLAMGMPYEEAMQGPVGQITAYQAALSRYQTARGVASLQGKIGAQQMLGLYPSEEMGTLMGQVGAPVLSGLGAGLMTGVGLTTAGNLLGGATGVLGGIGSFATAAAAPLALGVGAAVGGGLALGQIYQAGSTSNLQREWSEIAMGQRD
ncbi:MAG: 3'-5' exonuclease, partial [Dehalococcoidales bacterium]|nr:3'-5' exonuclease [Dehalococcoidales bacterium]